MSRARPLRHPDDARQHRLVLAGGVGDVALATLLDDYDRAVLSVKWIGTWLGHRSSGQAIAAKSGAVIELLC